MNLSDRLWENYSGGRGEKIRIRKEEKKRRRKRKEKKGVRLWENYSDDHTFQVLATAGFLADIPCWYRAIAFITLVAMREALCC